MAYMSQEGYDKLVAELKQLVSVERPKASAAIAEARDKGAVAKKACSVACIGCGKCQKVCKFDAITIEEQPESKKCKVENMRKNLKKFSVTIDKTACL